MLVTGVEGSERGQVSLIDFASCFRFLQRGDLDWRYHLQQFYSNLRMVSEEAPRIFIENIKPTIINFLSLSPPTIIGIIEEIRLGELSTTEKTALRLLLFAEQEILAEEFVKWRI
jgi:hypothetical protein